MTTAIQRVSLSSRDMCRFLLLFLFALVLATSAWAAAPCPQVAFQHITLTAAPELNPLWTSIGSFVLAAALILRHSAKFRK
jgi:hypothetical protein